MALSFMALIILVVFGLFVIAGIATLCHKRTRWLGYLLLLLPVGMLAALTIWLFGFTRISSGHPSWLIFAIPIVGIVGVGVMAMLVALMSNQRTRPIGLTLLAVPPLLGLVLVMGMFVSFPVARQHQYETVSAHEQFLPPATIQQHVRHDRDARRRDRDPSRVYKSFNDGHVWVQPVVYTQPAKKSNKPKAETSSQKSGRVFEAIGTAFGKTWGDLQRAKANRPVATHKISPDKPARIKKTPPNKTPPPKNIADKAKKKPAEDEESQREESQRDEAEQIGEIVKILSVAVRNELPENVEINQFAVLRALGSIVERMIASEKQAEADVKETLVVDTAAKPDHKLDEKKPAAKVDKPKKQSKTNKTDVATAKKPESTSDAKKTSAVAVSAKKADTSNDKPSSSGKPTTTPAKPVENNTNSSPAKQRPDWVETSPQSVGDGYQMVFMVGPYTTRLECEQAMDGQLALAVSEYAELYLGREAAGKATLSPGFLRDHVIKEEFEEIYQSQTEFMGKMVRVYVRLLFDARTNIELKANYDRAIIEERLWAAGLGLGAILVMLSGCFSVLKFDEVTEGAYRARMVFALFFTVVMSIALLGTWFMTSARTLPEASESSAMQKVSDNSLVTERADSIPSDIPAPAADSSEYTTADATPPKMSMDYSLLLVALPACLLITMLFFKKTHTIALLLLSLGVVLAAGALLLVV